MKRSAPRVAAIHDISGLGRCSLAVILPVLAAMGSQCCPIPTAYLSAHTGFPPSDRAVFLDMTPQLEGVEAHWSELKVRLDAIYSGFLGSAEQIGLLQGLIRRLRQESTLVLVDPVMGDHGKAYRTYTPEMCRRMGALAAEADIITPNLTEAALLLGEPYREQPEKETLERWLETLSLGGKRSVVITGVSAHPGEVGAACLDRASGGMAFIMAPLEPGSFPGTGDLFSSVLLGALLRGEPLSAATGEAVNFVHACVRRTLALGTLHREGVEFEGLLGALMRR